MGKGPPAKGWLTLSRQEGECILIETESGERIWVRLVELRHDNARLSFAAPKTVKIKREEIADR